MFYTTHGEISDLAAKVNATVRKLSQRLNEFDSIAVRGTSGLLVGAPAAMMLGKPLIVVRKPDEHAHSSKLVEHIGPVGTRVLFLDDFVSGGGTRRAVKKHVESAHRGAKVVAEFLYAWDDTDHTPGQWNDLKDDGWPADDDPWADQGEEIPW